MILSGSGSGSGASGGREFVYASPILDLLRRHLEPEPLLQRPGHRPADRVRLPTRGGDYLVDGRASLGAKHLNQPRN